MIHGIKKYSTVLLIILIGFSVCLITLSILFLNQVQSVDSTVNYLYAQPRVGIVVNQNMEIIQVEPDGRGAQAGLVVGDTLLALYGKDVMTIQQARDYILYMRGDARTMKKVRSSQAPTLPTKAPMEGTIHYPTQAPASDDDPLIDDTDPEYPTRVALAQQAYKEIRITVERRGERISVTISLELKPEQFNSESIQPQSRTGSTPTLIPTKTAVPEDMLYL